MLTLRDMAVNGLVDELARGLGVKGAADVVLATLGFPPEQLPVGQSDPIAFWHEICRRIENGAIPGDHHFERLLGCAALRFPGNERLAPFRRYASTGVDSASNSFSRARSPRQRRRLGISKPVASLQPKELLRDRVDKCLEDPLGLVVPELKGKLECSVTANGEDRKRLSEVFEGWLTDVSAPGVMIVSGESGIGKTTASAELVSALNRRREDRVAIWIPMGDPDVIKVPPKEAIRRHLGLGEDLGSRIWSRELGIDTVVLDGLDEGVSGVGCTDVIQWLRDLVLSLSRSAVRPRLAVFGRDILLPRRNVYPDLKEIFGNYCGVCSSGHSREPIEYEICPWEPSDLKRILERELRALPNGAKVAAASMESIAALDLTSPLLLRFAFQLLSRQPISHEPIKSKEELISDWAIEMISDGGNRFTSQLEADRLAAVRAAAWRMVSTGRELDERDLNRISKDFLKPPERNFPYASWEFMVGTFLKRSKDMGKFTFIHQELLVHFACQVLLLVCRLPSVPGDRPPPAAPPAPPGPPLWDVEKLEFFFRDWYQRMSTQLRIPDFEKVGMLLDGVDEPLAVQPGSSLSQSLMRFSKFLTDSGDLKKIPSFYSALIALSGSIGEDSLPASVAAHLCMRDALTKPREPLPGTLLDKTEAETVASLHDADKSL